VLDVPVRLDCYVFDLMTLLKLDINDDGTRTHPFTNDPFKLNEIQAARDIQENIKEFIASAGANNDLEPEISSEQSDSETEETSDVERPLLARSRSLIRDPFTLKEIRVDRDIQGDIETVIASAGANNDLEPAISSEQSYSETQETSDVGRPLLG